MKIQIVTLIAIAALLLLGSAALAHPGNEGSSPLYVVGPDTAAGGDYLLASGQWWVSCSTSGGGYRLQGPSRPNQGAACCCTYLPTTVKSWP